MAEEHEVLVETELVVAGDQLVLQRALPGGGEAHRQAPMDDEPGCVEEDVVPLLRPEVGDGHYQHGLLRNVEFGPHVPSERSLAVQCGLGAGQVHTVDDHLGPGPEGPGQCVVGGLRHGDEGPVAPDGGPIEHLDQR